MSDQNFNLQETQEDLRDRAFAQIVNRNPQLQGTNAKVLRNRVREILNNTSFTDKDIKLINEGKYTLSQEQTKQPSKLAEEAIKNQKKKRSFYYTILDDYNINKETADQIIKYYQSKKGRASNEKEFRDWMSSRMRDDYMKEFNIIDENGQFSQSNADYLQIYLDPLKQDQAVKQIQKEKNKQIESDYYIWALDKLHSQGKRLKITDPFVLSMDDLLSVYNSSDMPEEFKQHMPWDLGVAHKKRDKELANQLDKAVAISLVAAPAFVAGAGTVAPLLSTVTPTVATDAIVSNIVSPFTFSYTGEQLSKKAMDSWTNWDDKTKDYLSRQAGFLSGGLGFKWLPHILFSGSYAGLDAIDTYNDNINVPEWTKLGTSAFISGLFHRTPWLQGNLTWDPIKDISLSTLNKTKTYIPKASVDLTSKISLNNTNWTGSLLTGLTQGTIVGTGSKFGEDNIGWNIILNNVLAPLAIHKADKLTFNTLFAANANSLGNTGLSALHNIRKRTNWTKAILGDLPVKEEFIFRANGYGGSADIMNGTAKVYTGNYTYSPGMPTQGVRPSYSTYQTPEQYKTFLNNVYTGKTSVRGNYSYGYDSKTKSKILIDPTQQYEFRTINHENPKSFLENEALKGIDNSGRFKQKDSFLGIVKNGYELEFNKINADEYVGFSTSEGFYDLNEGLKWESDIRDIPGVLIENKQVYSNTNGQNKAFVINKKGEVFTIFRDIQGSGSGTTNKSIMKKVADSAMNSEVTMAIKPSEPSDFISRSNNKQTHTINPFKNFNIFWKEIEEELIKNYGTKVTKEFLNSSNKNSQKFEQINKEYKNLIKQLNDKAIQKEIVKDVQKFIKNKTELSEEDTKIFINSKTNEYKEKYPYFFNYHWKPQLQSKHIPRLILDKFSKINNTSDLFRSIISKQLDNYRQYNRIQEQNKFNKEVLLEIFPQFRNFEGTYYIPEN